jgi:succinate dehydrogenase hydrophobic anchor subunit
VLSVVDFGCFSGAIAMRWAMRILGGLNIVSSLFGLYYFAWGIEIHLGKWPGNPTRWEWNVFLAISALSTFLVLYLAYLGVRLIKLDYSALGHVRLAFELEISICLLDFFLTWIATPSWIRGNVIWFWGIATFPLEPQVLSGYELIGLAATFVMILARRRSSHALAGNVV